MTKDSNINQKSKKTKNAPKKPEKNGIKGDGYGYLKRRLGLLSDEIEKTEEQRSSK